MMSDTIKGSIIGALITVVGSILVFVLGNFSTQSTIEEKTVETLSGYFDSVNKDMSYEQALQTVYKENEQLKEENNSYISSLIEANNQIVELQSQKNQELENMKQQYNNEIQNKYDVDFQNTSLILNGISANYSDKVAIINNETYYSIGFLQYLVDSGNVSEKNKKLFIGDIQSEEQMPISLFDLKYFTEGHLIKTANEEDNFGNTFEEAFIVLANCSRYDNLVDDSAEYYIDGKYSKFCFDIAFSKDANQNAEYDIVILGDGKQLKIASTNRKSKPESIEVDISGVKYLQIVGVSNGIGYDLFSLMINPYLYP